MRYLARDKFRGEEDQILEFLQSKTEEETSDIHRDLTEDLIDQAIFETNFTKSEKELDEYKSKPFSAYHNRLPSKEQIRDGKRLPSAELRPRGAVVRFAH